MLDLTSKVFDLPAGLIMRIHPLEIEVFVASNTINNPYEKGELASLNTGLYCETVLATKKMLLVPDALRDPEWDHNPDIELGMTYYLGFPINWPNGEPFGTICVLDSKNNPKATQYKDCLFTVKKIAEDDLNSLIKQEKNISTLENRAILTEERYRVLFESSSEAFLLIDKKGIVDSNRTALNMFGFSTKEEFIGLHPADISPKKQPDGKDSRIASQDKLSEAFKKGFAKFEWVHRRKNGEEFPAEVWQTCFSLDDEQILQVTVRDITERKQAEEALRKSEGKYRSLFQHNSAVMMIIDPETGNIMDANPSACSYYGYSKKELNQMKISDINMLSKEKVLEEIEDARSEKKKRFIFTHRLSGGEMRNVEVYSCPITINDKKLLYSIVHDVTDRKRAEEALQNSESKLHSFMESATEGFALFDSQMNLMTINETALTIYQDENTKENLIGMNILEIAPHLKETNRYNSYLDVLRTGEPFQIDELASPTFGKKHVSVRAFKTAGGLGFIFTDITERKEAEIALQKSEHKFRTFFNNSNDSTIIYNLDGQILEVNDVACEFTGYNRHEMLCMSKMDLDSAEYALKVMDNIKKLQEIKQSIFESEIICKDGRLVPVELSTRIIEYTGKPAILSTARDLTERKKTEEAMLNAKLAAEAANLTKTEFVSNMSHELRTPLNSIIGFSDVLCNENFGILNEYQKKYASNVLKNGKHLLQLINDILSVSNIEAGEMELHINEFFVSDYIDEVEALMMPIASEKSIELTCNIDIETPIIKADMVKFKQILYNLVNNAIKFTDQGGKVTIGGKVTGDFVHISVTDTGIGISPENQDKLFNPFYQVDSSTTREYGGTGLGLPLVKKFVEMHGGDIWVESELGKGSTFGFSIPIDSKLQ
ncbi:PAS domain S-box protein [Methanococcoides orientis]|uniref:PAS domain S-box protein n=1 Tax=Methanococcoides orientis TaxID=2822137 RepID=UPI001E528965|nr:PAS domain S-box protein [Methanococcoides orientis]UGV40246.1 PAS domain S-box protein [Methanococcoides orientis]